jgi:hypothetical protein
MTGRERGRAWPRWTKLHGPEHERWQRAPRARAPAALEAGPFPARRDGAAEPEAPVTIETAITFTGEGGQAVKDGAAI